MATDYVFDVYKKLHEIPEASYKEFKTSAFCANEFNKLGLEVKKNIAGTTGFIAILDSGNPGKTIGVRADMDALPYEVDGEIEYRHTCGHDGHMSIVLATAKRMTEKGIDQGRILFVFQPAEEVSSGALSMLSEGDLDELDEMIGIHVRPPQDIPFGKAIAALRHSAQAAVNIEVIGKEAHASRPHLGVNSIEVAMNMIQAVYSLKVNPTISHSIKCTRFNSAPGADNIIPSKAEFYFDIRCEDNDALDEFLEQIQKVVRQVADAFGAEVKVGLDSTPGADFDEDIVDSAAKAIAEVLGEENMIRDFNNPGSDDFHNYARKLPNLKAGFIGLGADAAPGLHDINMQFNLDAMPIGVDILE